MAERIETVILGHGDLAAVLPKEDDKLFFASGVSNSKEKRQSEYDREVMLLLKQPRETHLVYFSSLAIFYSETAYTRHKLRMEAIVKTWDDYTIIRLGNIDWGNNKHTLINYLKKHPKAEIRDEYRYVISKDEFLHWISLIPTWPVEMNCPGRMMKVQQIKEEYCA